MSNNELMVPEKLSELQKSAPQILADNAVRVQRAKAYGESLLRNGEKINDDVYKEGLEYLAKVRKTVTLINGNRKPITQFLNEIAKQFTSLESEIDPGNPASIPAQVQKMLDDYATKIAQQKAAEEALRNKQKQIDLAKIEYKANLETEANKFFIDFLRNQVDLLEDYYNSATVDNFAEVTAAILNNKMPVLLDTYFEKIVVYKNPILSESDVADIRASAIKTLVVDYTKRLDYHYNARKEQIIGDFDRRYQELVALEAANEKEKEALLKQKEQEEIDRQIEKEKELAALTSQVSKAVEVNKSAETVNTLFATAPQPTSDIKTKSVTEIEVIGLAGWGKLIMFYFEKEGHNLSDETLEKKFGFVKKFAETYHEKNGEKIESPSLKYHLKAKAK